MSNSFDAHDSEVINGELKRILGKERFDNKFIFRRPKPLALSALPIGIKRSLLYRGLKKLAAIPKLGPFLLVIYRGLLDMKGYVFFDKKKIKQIPFLGAIVYWCFSIITWGYTRQQLFREIAELRLNLSRNTQLQDQFYKEWLTHRSKNFSTSDIEQRLASLQAQVRALEELKVSSRLPTLSKLPQIEFSNRAMDQFYWDLEARFRGSSEEIRKRLLGYGDLLDQLKRRFSVVPIKALDVGCGRGEWLDILVERGIEARGIDSNARMVDMCVEKGISVNHIDLLEGLEQEDDNSLHLISALHVVEHLPLDILLRFVDLAQHKLCSGGVLLLEAPNPENLQVGAHTFYLDPTHLRPIPPALLQFIVEHRGFMGSTILPLHPYPVDQTSSKNEKSMELLSQYLFGPQDYAVYAIKP